MFGFGRNKENGSFPDIPLDKLEALVLTRMERFARLTGETSDQSGNPSSRKFAKYAALSGYRDCAALGLEREARDILNRALNPTNPNKSNNPQNR